MIDFTREKINVFRIDLASDYGIVILVLLISKG